MWNPKNKDRMSIKKLYYMCSTIHMFYTCNTYVGYTPTLPVCNMCVICVLHIYYECMNYMCNTPKTPHMYCMCVTHVLYIWHIDYWYSSCAQKHTIGCHLLFLIFQLLWCLFLWSSTQKQSRGRQQSDRCYVFVYLSHVVVFMISKVWWWSRQCTYP